MKATYVLVLCAAALVGCATGYKPASQGILKGTSGGYSEARLRDDVYRVSFSGNAYTSARRAAEFALLRCAELTRQNGFDYFVIVDEAQVTEVSTVTTPSTTNTNMSAPGLGKYATGNWTFATDGGDTYYVQKPHSTNTILMMREPGEFGEAAYEAASVIDSIRASYNLD